MKTSSFDLGRFQKIEDIIYLDEPILSHLALDSRNYFLYLVDTVDNRDIFLLFEVSEKCLYSYLTKIKNLYQVITDSTFVNVIEQDFDGQVLNTELVFSQDLPDDYLPNLNSFLEFQPVEGSHYFEKIKEINQNHYLLDLRKSAFYLKFASETKKYGDTIGLRELTSKLLDNLSSSFRHFTEIEFLKSFGGKIPDDKQRNSIFTKILPDLDFRLVDFNFGSFEVGLSVDKVMKTNVEDKEVREWADNIGDLYKQRVLDDNIDEGELETIISQYTELERNKIFKPLLNIVSDTDYSLKIRDSNQGVYKALGIKNKRISSKIVTKNVIEEIPTEQDYKIINLTTVINERKGRRVINIENSLFNIVENSTYQLLSSDFIKYGYTNIPMDVSITLNIENKENHIFLNTSYSGEYFETDITEDISNNKFEEGVKKMIDKIYEFIVNR